MRWCVSCLLVCASVCCVYLSIVSSGLANISPHVWQVHAECIKRGVYPSPLNYYKFPKSVCVSVNEVVCRAFASTFSFILIAVVLDNTTSDPT
eukprot:SAG31_NODE_1075_length_10048_cov_21.627701_6_plen_93_part_00